MLFPENDTVVVIKKKKKITFERALSSNFQWKNLDMSY